MASISADSISKPLAPISTKHPKDRGAYRCSIRFSVSSSKDDLPPQQYLKKNQRSGKAQRAVHRLISISTSSGGRWGPGQWSCDYVFSLRQLRLADLAEDGQKDSDVFVTLTVQKHAGFGFSVDGRIITSFTRKCSCCFSSYSKEINTTFDVWVLPSSKNSEAELPEIGGNDPSLSFLTRFYCLHTQGHSRNNTSTQSDSGC